MCSNLQLIFRRCANFFRKSRENWLNRISKKLKLDFASMPDMNTVPLGVAVMSNTTRIRGDKRDLDAGPAFFLIIGAALMLTFICGAGTLYYGLEAMSPPGASAKLLQGASLFLS